MALIWADNFEMYGTVENLLDGVYAESYPLNSLIKTSGEAYLRISGNGLLRKVLPSPVTTIGESKVLFFEGLPTGVLPATTEWRTSSNTVIAQLRVETDGRLSFYRGGVLIGSTSSPVITSNAKVYVETKLTIDPVEGSIEVRVRGRTVLLLEELNTGSAPVAQMVSRYLDSTISPYRIYQWIEWDSTGAVNNDFLGQVQVFWSRPIVTRESGGWTSSADAPAHETIDKPSWANQLTASGNIVNSDTVRIQNVYYRWTSGTVATGAGTAANPWLVALGADSAESLKNMYEAINASGIPGTTYSPDLVEHPLVKGFGLIVDAFCVIPKVEGTTTMTFSETGTALAWTSTTTFLSRVWDPIRMSAGYIPAVKAAGFLTFSGNPLENDTVAVGGTSFTFKASPTGPTDVAIGGSPSVTATNLATAIGLNVPTVTAEAVGLVVDITAVSAGALGNTISLASTSAVITTSDSTLEGGEDITYPDPFVVGLTPLPDDVTSIRAVIPVVRAAKLDGGDGNIQVSFGTLNTNYDVGPDTPITNAFTYWGNATEPFVSEINPDTGTPWTPGEFNLGARIRVARTK